MSADEKANWRQGIEWHTWLHDFGFGVSVRQHAFRTPEEIESRWNELPCTWNTYLHFSDKLRLSRDEKMCPPYREVCPITEFLWTNRNALNGLDGWNGGTTFEEFVVEDKYKCRRIKIGDDYAHLWDTEDRRFELYSLEYMQRRVLALAREARDLLQILMAEKRTTHAGE